MPVDIQDVKQVAEELGGRFEEFKKANDKRIDGIEAEKTKLSEAVDTLNQKLTDLDRYKTELEEELKNLKRPGQPGGENKAKSEHVEAFRKYFCKGHDDGLRDLEQKALNTQSDPDGGFFVPEEMAATMDELATDVSPMRQEATVINTNSQTYKKLVNKHGATAGWVGETEDRTETGTPSLAELEFNAMELYAEPHATQSMLDDSAFNIETWLGDEVSIAFADQEGAAFIDGNGVKKPRGILSYDLVANASYKWGKLGFIKSGANGAFASSDPADKLIDLVHSLRKRYRNGAKFMMNDLTLAAVRKLKDTEGNYLWRPGLEAGVPSTLLSYMVAENEDMPDLATNSYSLAFGNFKRGYLILDRIGVRVLRDPFTRKPYVKFYTTKRVGGGVQNFEAIKLMKFAS